AHADPSASPSLSLHDALPIWADDGGPRRPRSRDVTRSLGAELAAPLLLLLEVLVALEKVEVRVLVDPAHLELRAGAQGAALRPRSEEHTSELQSRENLVCRLL